MFKADGTTNLTGTGRVKKVLDNHTLVADQKYLVVAGSGSHDIDNDGVAEAIAKDQYITVSTPVATGLAASATGGAEGVQVMHLTRHWLLLQRQQQMAALT